MNCTADADPRFTVLPGEAHDVQLSHFSPNFDRTGIIEDLDVVYPIDRLAEPADAGVIGSVDDLHSVHELAGGHVAPFSQR